MEFLKHLKLVQQEIQRQWANGGYTTEKFEGTIQLNSEALGKYRALDYVTELDYETIKEGI